MKPVAQPNRFHNTILGALLDNKTTMRTEIRGKRDVKGKWVLVEVHVPVPTIAGNVSNLNVELAAKRWIS